MSVLNQFKEAIRIQQNKENESYDEQIRLPLEERVAKGVTITHRVFFSVFILFVILC